MPDVWTMNRSKLRDHLLESGSTCGIPPRVLPGHDPEWTCTYDSKNYLRDIYIHPVYDLYWHIAFFFPLITALICGIFIGLIWGRHFWRPAQRSA